MKSAKKKTFFSFPKSLKLAIAIFILLFILAVLAFKSIQGPSKGIINESSSANPSSASGTGSTVRFEGQQISFAYPERYLNRTGDHLPPSVLESYRLVAPGKPGAPAWTIALTVYNLPSGSLSDSSSYKIRADNPSQYLRSVSDIKGRRAIFFKRADGTETVVFFQTPAKLTAVGFSGGVHQPEANRDFESILSSLEWL